MHQQSRHPPRGSSPAVSAQTNPTRTNNPRDNQPSRMRSAPDTAPPGPPIDFAAASGSGSNGAISPPSSTSPAGAGPTRESIKKLDQIIQNFFLKAAVLIIQARIPVTPSGGSRGRKTNKWFQIETDDIDDFKDELRVWKNCSSFDARRQPMVIETYLDASRLAPGQALVVIDENGKRWDALEALNTSSDMSASGSSGSGSGSGQPDAHKIRTRSTEIILERWKVELQSIPSLSGGGGSSSGGTSAEASPAAQLAAAPTAASGIPASSLSALLGEDMGDFGPILPTIYKRSIVFFRSLFVTTHVLPAYRFSRQATTKGVHPAMAVRCRVLTGAESDARINATGFDNLRQPLYFDGPREPTIDYMFGDLEVPVGRLSTSVTYRVDCNFRIDDSESLLSSRFMGLDENYFRPSLPPSQRPDSFLAHQQPQRLQNLQQPPQHPPQHPLQHPQHAQWQPQQNRQFHPVLHQQYTSQFSHDAEVGSLPSRQHGRNLSEQSFQPYPQQTYGSLSTFHGAGALGTSPISALKAVRPIGSDTSSPTDSIRPSSLEQTAPAEPPHSLPIVSRGGHHYHRISTSNLAATTADPSGASAGASTGTSARPLALRNLETGGTLGRRPSVSFQPFKAGSLSGSPRLPQEEFGSAAMPVPSSPLSGSRPASGLVALAQARNRSSLTAGMAASLRGVPPVSTSVGSAYGGLALIDPGQSPSPRPGGSGSRYSSSFTHRRGRSSFGGASRAEDDQGSSGKQSVASSMVQPGSGLLAEIAVGGSSFQTDEDNISEFLKALESKKTLQSFEPGGSGSGHISSGSSSRRGGVSGSGFSDSAARRTVAQLSRFQLMRESNIALTDSMSLSIQMGATAGGSGTSAAATSMSISMSPKPLSPHTPHTPHMPAVPSRLSENAIIDYQQGQPAVLSNTSNSANRRDTSRDATPTAEHSAAPPSTKDVVTAIDIPLSPRLRLEHQHHRSSTSRSISVVQKKHLINDDEVGNIAAFGNQHQRSLSVGAGRAATATATATATTATPSAEPPSLSSFFRLGGNAPVGVASTARGAASDSANTEPRPTTSPAVSTDAGASLTAGTAQAGAPTSAMAAALRSSASGSTTASGTVIGTSPRRRYISQRLRKETTDSVDSNAAGAGSSASICVGDRPSALPALSSSSRGGSISGSFTGRYGGSNRRRSGSSGTPGGPGGGTPGGTGADGEADEEPLVFDMLEIGREPNRRSLEEGRGCGPHGPSSNAATEGPHHPGWHN